MSLEKLAEKIRLGEDSQNQFKLTIESPDSLAAEICAFANSRGGCLIIGVKDNSDIVGISNEKLNQLNQMISNVTSSNIKPPLFVETELFSVEGKRILVVKVPMGSNKPYEASGGFWVKDGADKRKAQREELFRLFQASSNLFADEMDSMVSLTELDDTTFIRYYEESYEEKWENKTIETQPLLQNLKLATTSNHLTLAGLLLFGKHPTNHKPQFSIKATHFDGLDRSVNNYIDKEDIGGSLIEQFERGLNFISRNLKRIQLDRDFNYPGVLEIPEIIFQEALANAIVHRNYFIQSPIMIDLFSDRLEITSPGKLPNTLTEESIRLGIHIERNPILLTFMQKMKNFKYTGRGSGIPRMIRVSKEKGMTLNFINDTKSERFTVQAFKLKNRFTPNF